MKTLKNAHSKMLQAHQTFIRLNAAWGFKVYEHYDVILTLYGSGGSYHPEDGKIILKTTRKGDFVRKNPIHTIVHEMVHLGIHHNIVKAYTLSHWEKEQLVDFICLHELGDILTGYQCNTRAKTIMGNCINKTSMKNLPEAVKECLKENRLPDDFIIAIMVDKVFSDSQAQKAGLQKGDILIRYEDRSILNKEDIVRAVNDYNKKQSIQLSVLRDHKRVQFTIKGGSLGIRIANTTLLKKNAPRELIR